MSWYEGTFELSPGREATTLAKAKSYANVVVEFPTWTKVVKNIIH